MPTILVTLSPLLALLQAGAGADRASDRAADRAAERWQALPLPSLAVAPPTTAGAPRLLEGHHLLFPGEELPEEAAGSGAALPVPALLELLQEDASRQRQVLRLQPTAPPLLARGSPEALAAGQALLEGLDRQTGQLDIELSAWLTPGAARVGAYPSPQVVQAAVEGTPPLGTTLVRSGGTAVLGARSATTFLAGYSVEIASGSGVAGPALGQVLSGHSLHLRASGVRDGRGIALEGFLDLAELRGMEDFDPGTADLGLIQQPRVGAIQVAFSGVVAPGGALSVAIEGAPLSEPDWTLWLVARRADPGEGADASWRARDVAFLAQPAFDLPLPRPGSVLGGQGDPRDEPRTLVQPLSPAEVAQAADAARAASGRPGRTPIVWGGGLVLAPRGEDALWAEVDALVGAAEQQQLRTSWLEVVQGDLKVGLPLLVGRAVRVLAVEERAVLGGYDLQVAQDTWMPLPVVERVMDGLLVQGRQVTGQVSGRFEGRAWRSSSAPPRELGREQTGLARVQLGQRELASAAVRVTPGRWARAIAGPVGAEDVLVRLEGLP